MLKFLKHTANPNTTSLLDIVITALAEKYRIPGEAPRTTYPPSFHRDALCAFSIDRVEGGFVANIEFDMAPGEADTIGTPRAHPLPTHRDAFLAGAAILCKIVTGSHDLPFLVLGDELVVVAVTPQGSPFMLRRPFPTQCK